MSDRYTAWLGVLAERDRALWSLFVLAGLFVVAWHVTPLVGDLPVRKKVQVIFLIGGLIVFYGSLAYLLLAGG